MKLIAALLKYINTVVLAFFGGFKDIVTFLTLYYLFVVLAKYFYRYKIESLTTTSIIRIYMYAIVATERHRFQMIDKVFHCSCLR